VATVEKSEGKIDKGGVMGNPFKRNVLEIADCHCEKCNLLREAMAIEQKAVQTPADIERRGEIYRTVLVKYEPKIRRAA
jgi:hypothetical protein